MTPAVFLRYVVQPVAGTKQQGYRHQHYRLVGGLSERVQHCSVKLFKDSTVDDGWIGDRRSVSQDEKKGATVREQLPLTVGPRLYPY
ncbi:MAG: hypothetical protein RMK62_07750 [Armatimonadota bacterium]|nr:hypothetical protein [Armatimonadota bacterium]